MTANTQEALPKQLLDLIGEYGMARTDGVGELEVQHRWLLLIAGIKAYAKSLAALSAAPSEPVVQLQELTDEFRAALLWLLWHHQGGSSKIGQPIRLMLGLGQHERMNDEQVETAKQFRALLSSQSAERKDACDWWQDAGESDSWRSSCGEFFTFNDGGPTDNRMKFCHGCGKPLKELPWEDAAITEQQKGAKS